MKKDTIHHRKPTSIGGSNKKKNLSYVGVVKHRAWHTLFQNYDAHEIKSIINKTWLDPDYKFFIVRKNKHVIPKSKLKWTTH